MKYLDIEKITQIIEIMTETIIKNEVYFCELDSAAGDGDFGMSLSGGFKVIKKESKDYPKEDIGAFLKACGNTITEFCGGASGPIWGSAFRSAAKYASGKTELSLTEIGEMMQSAVKGIQKRGKAELGDKTLLDALIPATESLIESAQKRIDMQTAFENSSKASVLGAENTKNIVASKGRATYLGDRSLGYPDAGAVAIGIILTDIYEQIKW